MIRQAPATRRGRTPPGDRVDPRVAALAGANYQAGRPDDAADPWEIALRFDPDFKVARRTLRVLRERELR